MLQINAEMCYDVAAFCFFVFFFLSGLSLDSTKRTAARLPDHPVHRAREEYCYISFFGSVIEVHIC